MFWKLLNGLFVELDILIKQASESLEDQVEQKSRTSDLQLQSPSNKLKLVKDNGETYQIDQDKLITIPNQNVDQFVMENRDKIYKHSLDRYREAIEKDLDKVEIYLYQNQVLGAKRHEIKPNLEKMFDYWVDTENYELAQETKELLHKIEDGDA